MGSVCSRYHPRYRFHLFPVLDSVRTNAPNRNVLRHYHHSRYQTIHSLNMTTDIQKINAEVGKELANKETFNALVTTTFKGLKQENVKKAIVEGMMRGFTFQDFLKKNIYAIPYGEGYSLVGSIDYARKIGMRSGVIGVSEPVYEMDGAKVIACSITIKRKVGNDIGDFSAKVYFDEYTTRKNQWASKPRTMIVKVAEMHALRKACPEELSQVYTSDEMGDKAIAVKPVEKIEPIDLDALKKKLHDCKTIEDLKKVWSAIPFEAKVKLERIKNLVKTQLK